MHIRAISKAEADAAPELPIRIPIYPKPSSPFSKGRFPLLYRPAELGNVIENNQSRTIWFFKRLCAIQRIIENDIPYYFIESNGELRSLDAGCLGYLRSTPVKTIDFGLGTEGEIVTVRITSEVLGRQNDLDQIIAEMDTRS